MLQLFRFKVQVVIQGHEDSVASHVAYVARLYQSLPGQSSAEAFEAPYRDYLQAPLQPLSDNLDSQTYETFEKDPVKYVQYEEAVFRCLRDKLAGGGKDFVIMVVGAGRGPLVAASISASKRAGVTPRIWAVEKNPNAVITLRGRKAREAKDGWDW